MLSVLIFLPLLVALAIALAPRTAARPIAIATSAVALVIAAAASLFRAAPSGGYDLVEAVRWIPALSIEYRVGIDGVSGLLVLMTALLTLMACVVPSRAADGRERVYYACLLATMATTIGAFCALDLILFYVFFEACLVPVYFLIGLFGGKTRQAAATKFLVYTVVASLLMLAALLALYVQTGTFDISQLPAKLAAAPLAPTLSLMIFLGFAVAFAVKTPLFPFHTWQADAYAQCPTGGVVLLSGALAKLGTYGFYRFCIGLFPDIAKELAPAFVALAVIGIVYGALVAAVQKDVKKLIAFSSVSHLGFVILGLFSFTSIGMSGALLQNINHGITTGALFLIAGLIEDRTGTRQISRLGGLWGQMPVLGRLFLIVTLSAVALPLTNGFVGEFLILLGAFSVYPWAVAVAVTGVIWSAVYMLWMFQRVMYGAPQSETIVGSRDIHGGELVGIGALVGLILVLGVAPNILLRPVNAALAGSATPAANASAHPATTILSASAAEPGKPQSQLRSEP